MSILTDFPALVLSKSLTPHLLPFEPLFDPSMFIFHKNLAIRSMTWKYFNVISTPLIQEFGIFYKIVGFFLPTETSKRAIIRSILGLAPIIYQKAKYKYLFQHLIIHCVRCLHVLQYKNALEAAFVNFGFLRRWHQSCHSNDKKVVTSSIYFLVYYRPYLAWSY